MPASSSFGSPPLALLPAATVPAAGAVPETPLQPTAAPYAAARCCRASPAFLAGSMRSTSAT
eukprot:12397575-Alexandrium_andersonii.AAC.1